MYNLYISAAPANRKRQSVKSAFTTYLLPRLFLLLLGVGFTASARSAAMPLHPKSIAQDQVPAGLAQSDWSSIRAAHNASRHAFTPTPSGWQAQNPGQQWTTTFDQRGFLTAPKLGGWTWGLELLGYGIGELQRTPQSALAMRADSSRLTYQWDATVQEWFVNDQHGLEHGFTVSTRPAGPTAPGVPSPALSFLLAVRGELRPRVTPDALGVEFQDTAGATVLNYAGLKVWDADGKILTSRFELADSALTASGTQPALRLLVDDAAARYPITIDPIAQQAYLKASQVNALDNFGSAVAISSDTVVVGAYHEDSGTTGVNSTPTESVINSGAAYVFVRSGSGTTWTQQAYLKASQVTSTDSFGYAVAISGDTIVVGAYGEDSDTTGINSTPNELLANTGAAYIFQRSGTTWTQQAYLKASQVNNNDNFGISVAISGGTVVVGATSEASSTTGVNSTPDELAPVSGAAYVFLRNGTTWTQQAYLKASQVTTGDFFGRSVAIAGNIIVVGAPYEDSSTTGVNSTPDESAADSGAAYVFLRSGTTWTQEAYLKAQQVSAGDNFGASVAITGGTVVVGARNEDSSSTGVNSTPNELSADSGAVYVFLRSGTTWSQQAYLKANQVTAGDGFGNSVAVAGDILVVGANSENSSTTGVNSTPDALAANSGAAYVYVRTGTTWTQQAYLKASQVNGGDNFGASVAVSGIIAVVSADAEDSSTTGVNSTPDELASAAGAAYIFTGLGQGTMTSPTSASITADSATLGADFTSTGGATVLASGILYSQTATNSNPQVSGAGVTALASPGTTGVFTVSATGLTPFTSYTYVAYVTTSMGTTYSSTDTFTTLLAITSSLTASGTYGSVLTPYNITTSGTPTSYSASGLPAGLSVNTATGAITGTPTTTVGSPFNVTIGATNSAGTSTATLVLTIDKVPLTVVADAKSRVYGVANPTFTASFTGFVNSDTSAVVTGAAALTSTAITTSSVGTYPITPTIGTLAADNYTFTTFTDGILTISKASQTITFGSLAAKTYGSAPFTISATASSGLSPTFNVPSGPATVSGTTITITGVGTVIVRANQAGNTNYAAAPFRDQSFIVSKGTPTITWATPSAIAYGTVLSATQLNASGSVAGTIAYSPISGTLLNAGTQTLSATFTPTDTGNYNTATSTVSLVVAKATPTVTWANPSAITYGTTLSATQLNASSSVPGSFVYTPAIGSTPNAGTQTLSTTFTPTDTVNYNTVTQTVSLVVGKATPTLTWATPSAITYGAALSATQLNASGSVPGAIVYSPASGTILTVGTQTLTATFTPTDTTNYNNTSGTVSLVVSKATPTITWATPSAITYGTALSATQLNATGSVPGTIVYSPISGTTLFAGTQTLSATFTPTDTVNYTTANRNVSLVVNKATPTVTWATPSAITYGTTLSATQLNASSSVAGSFVYTPAIGSTPNAGTQTLSTTFTPTDTANYNTVTQTVSLVVGKVTPTVTWATPSAITYGATLSATQLNASASVPGSFVYTPAIGSTPNAGTQTLSTTFTPTDTVNYNTVTTTVSLVVGKVTSTITWATPSAITYGTALSATQLNATGSVAGTIVYSPISGTTLTVGTQTLSATFTPTDTVNYTTANRNVSLVVNKATPTITWATPIAITYGTALSVTQLNATGSVPGTIAYSPISGTTLNAGTQTLSATFTPTDTANYNTATSTVSLVVAKATPTVTWATPSAITYGTTLTATQLNASSSVLGSFVYTPAIGSTPNAGTQTLSTTFTPTDTANYNTVTQTVSLVVGKVTPILTWATPIAITYGTPLSATQLNASSSVLGSFVYSPASGTTPNAGTQTLSTTFTPTDTVNYNAVTTTVSLVVSKATPTITWATPSAITYGTALSATQLNATGSVPGTIAYSPISGTTLNAGTQTLSATFTPTDTANYNTATSTVSLVVAKATPTVTWANPSAITYGTTLSATQLNASASVPGSFIYTPAIGSTPNAGTQTLSTTFTPTDTANYNTVTQTVSLVVGKVTPTITWANPSAITYGTTLTATQLNASSSVAGAFVYTPASGSTPNAGTQTLSTTFTPTDTVNYTPVTTTVSLIVSKATPTITWATPSAITYGTPLSATQLNASGSVAGTIAYSPISGTTLNAGTQTLSATFTPTDTANYNTATSTVSLVVAKATPTVTWATPSAIAYGTMLSATQLNASSSVVGSFVYTPASGSTPNAGTQTLSTTFTPTDTVNYNTVTQTVSLVVGKVTPTLTWATPSAITYGTALSATQLNASGNVAGAIVYSPISGTTLTAGTQTLSATFTPTDTSNYTTANRNVSLVVNKATPTLTWATPSAITYGTALSATQLNASSSVAGSFVYSPAIAATPNAGTQTLSTTFTPTDTANYETVTTTVSLVVGKATPTLTWATPSAIIYGTTLSATQLNATGSVPGAIVYSPASGAMLTVGTQTLSATFTPTDTANYNTATGTVSLVVAKATPTITWATPSAITYGTMLSATQLNASSSVAGAFVYTPASGTTPTAGTQTLSTTFTPTDTVNYEAVTTTVSLDVGKVTPTITWATPSAITYGTALTATQLNASSSVAGAIVYSPASGATLNAGTQTLSATFTPTDTVNYNAVTTTVSLVVSKATPTLTWATPSAITYGTPLSATQLNAGGSVAGAIVYSPASGTTLNAGTQTLSATFTPTDTSNYNTVNRNVSLVVNKATPTLTWATPTAIAYGTMLSATQLNASSSVAGAFVYTPASGSTPNAGTQTLSTTFTPTNTANYNPVTTTVSLVVGKVTPTITWATPSAITYGTMLSATQLNASGSVAGTIVYSPAIGTALSVGTQTLSATFTPTDTANYNTATGTVSLVVGKATPTVTWATPSAITYGTTLSATQLNASCSIPGTIAYSPAGGTTPNAGTQLLSATFTPTDTVNYNTATGTVSLIVAKATPTVTWANPSSITYGTALSATQLNATGSVLGAIVYSPAIGTTLTAGTQTLSATFTPTDTANYTTVNVTASLVVDQATPTVTWATPNAIAYGTPLSATQLNASSSVAGAFVYSPVSGSILNVGTNTLTVDFTPTDTVNYTTVTTTVSLVVGKLTPTITWATPSAITYGTPLSATQLNASGSVAGATVYSPASGTTLSAGTQTLSATFTPTDIVNYTTVTRTVSLVVAKATPTLTWATPSAITYGTALSATQLNASGSVAGTIAYSPAVGTTLTVGTQTLTATFTPTDTANYNTATDTVSLVVAKATPTLTWATPSAIPYGTMLSATQLNASSSVAGAFVYTPGSGTTPSAGTQTLSTTFTPTDTVNYNPVTTTVSLVVGKVTPSLTWAAPSAIAYGTALSATQLNASGSVPGTIVYSPASGASLSVGTQTLSATFTPTDTVNYTTVSTTVSLVVSKATPTLTWSTPSSITYGAVLSATQLNATGSVPGTILYSPVSGTTLNAGTQTLSATFTPTDTANYNTATGVVSLVVAKATPTITWAIPSAITYGTTLTATQLNATANVAGTIVYSPNSGTTLTAGTQTLSATFTPTDTANYTTITTTVSLVVAKATPTMTWVAPSPIVYGTALSATQLNASGSVAGTIVYSPAIGTTPSVGTQTLSATFTPTDTVNYNPVTTTVSLVVAKATPAVTWATPTAITYGTALSATQLNASGSVPGTIVYSPAIGSTLGVGTQTLSATFTPTETVNYNPVTTTVSLVVNKAALTITWATPSAITYGAALSATQLNASGSVAGTFVYSPASGATLSVGTQTLSATFTPTDTANYTTVTKTVSLIVGKATPTLTWVTPSAITYGTPLSATQLNASGSVAGAIVYTPASGTTLNAGTQTLSATLTPTDTVNYEAVTTTVDLIVSKVTPALTWATPTVITYGTPLSATQLNASGSVLGSFVYSPASGSTLSAGTQTLSTTFTPADAVNYNSVTTTVSLVVSKATPILTWATPSAITYGTALSATQLNAGGNVAGVFVYSPASGSTLGVGSQTLSVTFTPTDTSNYTTANRNVSLVVGKATPTLTWATPSAITYGTALSATQLNASGSVPGAIAYSPGSGTTLNAGTQTLSATFTPTDTVNYNSASGTVSLVVAKATPTVTWTTPTAITYGTTLSATQLNASGSVPGAIVYSPASGTTPSAGTQTLTATFTPTDTANYNSASGTVSLVVTKATTTVTWATPTSITYGATLSATQLNASGSVPGTIVYSPASGTTPSAGTQTLTATFTPTDTINYNSSSGTVSLVVAKATATLTWATPPAITYGTALSATQLNASGNVPGTIVYSPVSGTTLSVGTQTLTATFTPTDTTNYNPASSMTSLVVGKATPTVTWATPSAITYGTALSATQLNAISSAAGAIVYSPVSGTTLSAGTQTLTATFTPTDTANYNSATGTASLVVNKATPTVTWATPSAIMYGTALSETQLNASGSVAGSIVYSHTSGMKPNVGTQTMTATFTPTDTVNYNSAIGSVSLTVLKSVPSAPTAVTVTTANGEATVTFTALSYTGSSAITNYTIRATATDGTIVTITATESPAKFTGLVPGKSYRFTVIANNSNGASDSSAPSDAITISLVNQTISFAPIADRSSNSSSITLSAKASSNLPVIFTIVSGPALLSGNTLDLTGAPGTVTVRASQAGNATYAAAPDVNVTFAVTTGLSSVVFGKVYNPASQENVADIAAVLPSNSREGSFLIVSASNPALNGPATFVLGNGGVFSTTFLSAVGSAQPLEAGVQAAPVIYTISGTLINDVLSGTIAPLGLVFSSKVPPPKGPTAASAGFYKSVAIGEVAAVTYTVLGSNNEILVLTQGTAVTMGGLTTLKSDNTYALATTTAGGNSSLSGSFNPLTTGVSNTLMLFDNSKVIFIGLSTATTRTDRLINLSSRAKVGTGESVLITGFVIGGAEPKKVLIRAAGPALSAFGLSSTLSNPTIKIYQGSSLIAQNDDWNTVDAAEISRLGAFAFNVGSKDSALLTTLAPGSYTAQVSDVSDAGTGVALAEIYDASVNPNSEFQRLVNISSRGRVTPDDGVLIGGFIITGNSPKKLLIRGIGPALTAFAIDGALADPALTIYQDGKAIATNEGWSNSAAIATAAMQTGAFALPNGSKDAAVLITLNPGAYTAQIKSAKNASSGVALIEIYEVP